MRLLIRFPKPLKKTVPIDLAGVLDQEPCLKDLISVTTDTLQLEQLSSDDVKFSLNNRDVLSGDDTALSELGVVHGDLLYIHLPEEYVSQSQNVLVPPEPAQQAVSDQLAPASNSSAIQNTSTHEAMSTSSTEPQASTSSDSEPLTNSSMEIQESTTSVTEPQPSTSSEIPSQQSREQVDISSHIDPADFAAVQEVQELSQNEVNQYLSRAMLIRESQEGDIPSSLLAALTRLQPADLNQTLFVVLHVLVTETGFTIKEGEQVLSPSVWSSPHKFTLNYKHHTPDSTGFTLVAVPMANTLLVHTVSEDLGAKYSITLKPGNYVRMVEGEATPEFQKLCQLSREVKDKITGPMLQYITGDCSGISLENLLYEAKMVILKHLDARSLLELSQTCSMYNMLCKTPHLWHRLFIKDFGKQKAKDKDPNTDWLKLYEEQYVIRKRVREQLTRARVVVPPPFLHRPLPSVPGMPAPWNPGFIIGGDYDRMPGGPLFPGMGLPRAPRFDPIGPLPDVLQEPVRSGVFNIAPRCRRHHNRSTARTSRLGGAPNFHF